jgi:hypothetical protein
MPPLIIAVVAAAATYATATALTGAVIFGVTVTAAAAAAIGSIVGAVVAYAGNALVASLSGQPKGKQDTSSAANDAKRTIRSEIAPRRVVYGRARVSGPLIYAGSFGANLENLLLVIPLADHEIEAIDAVWIGEYRVDASEIAPNGDVIGGRFRAKENAVSFAGKTLLEIAQMTSDPAVSSTLAPATVSIRRFLGNQTQADPQLVAECPDGWTAADKLTGIAHLVVRLRYDPELFQGGIPSISAEVRGKKVFDPRTSVTGYSENWALIVNDYLRSEAGVAAAADEVNTASVIAAANLSDENVQVTAEGATQKRYTLNGTFTLDRQPIDVLEEMLAAGGGALVYVAGEYRLYGGAYQAPAVTLTASDLASDVEVVTKPPRRELFNSVRGNYIEPNAFWQAYPMPPLEWLSFIAQDGETIWRELELPFVLDGTRAQRIAQQLLLRSRQGVTIRAAVKYANFNLSVWQTVAVTLADLGWSSKPFRIVAWQFSPESGLITLTMQEEQVASYAWSFDEAARAPEFPDTTLIDPFQTGAPAGLGVAEDLYVTRDGAGVRTKAILTWAAPPSPFVIGYDIEFKPAAETVWRAAPAVLEARGEVLDLAAGNWDFRVRARTGVGAGTWASVRAAIGGLAAQPPVAATGLSLATIGGFAFLRWDRTAELDVRVGGRYEIRHTPSVDSPTWAGATSIGDAVPGEATSAILPLKAGTYFIRAVDAGGVYGAVASINAAQATALAYANVSSVTEHAGFTGSKVNVAAAAGVLKLDGTGQVDDIADFDAVADLDALGGIAPSGTYTFAGGIDLGAVGNVRLTSRVLATVEDEGDQWDDRTDPIDTWGAIDGVFGGEADAWVEARRTDDNPAGTPAWSGWSRLDSAEFRARAFQFRAQLRSHDPAFNINVTELSVAADEVA